MELREGRVGDPKEARVAVLVGARVVAKTTTPIPSVSVRIIAGRVIRKRTQSSARTPQPVKTSPSTNPTSPIEVDRRKGVQAGTQVGLEEGVAILTALDFLLRTSALLPSGGGCSLGCARTRTTTASKKQSLVAVPQPSARPGMQLFVPGSMLL